VGAGLNLLPLRALNSRFVAAVGLDLPCRPKAFYSGSRVAAQGSITPMTRYTVRETFLGNSAK
jgi:hypothetical protein